MFVQLGLSLNSDMSMRICSEASIAESPLLAAGVQSKPDPRWSMYLEFRQAFTRLWLKNGRRNYFFETFTTLSNIKAIVVPELSFQFPSPYYFYY